MLLFNVIDILIAWTNTIFFSRSHFFWVLTISFTRTRCHEMFKNHFCSIQVKPDHWLIWISISLCWAISAGSFLHALHIDSFSRWYYLDFTDLFRDSMLPEPRSDARICWKSHYIINNGIIPLVFHRIVQFSGDLCGGSSQHHKDHRFATHFPSHLSNYQR